jgi:hypothetical protein
MLTSHQVLERMTPEEFIGLCEQVPEKFEVIETERDENLDLIVFVQLDTKVCKVVKVKTSWPISD